MKYILHTYLLTFLPIEKFCGNRKICRCDHYSRAETNQGRKLLLIIKRFWPRKLFKGGNYSRKYCIWKFWNQKKSCNRQIRPVWSSQGVWTPHTTAGEAAAAWSGGNFKEPRENWALHQYDLCSGQNLTLLHSISEKNNQSLCISLKKSY